MNGTSIDSPAKKTTAATLVAEVNKLKVHFAASQGIVASLMGRQPDQIRAVDGVSFKITEGEVLGLAGESGSGKTTVAKALLRLYRPTAGTIRFRGRDISDLEGRELTDYRRQAQMIFQDPYESLNPRFSVRTVLEEPLIIHGLGNAEERGQRVLDTLEMVGLAPPERYLERFPHQLSGGQRQRVAIGRAMVLEPQLMVADEPVSMLDVSIRAGVLNLMRGIIDEMKLAGLYISHDLSLIRHVCDQTAIMYLGRIVEIGPTEDVIMNPLHPYAQALLRAVPVPDIDQGGPMIPLEGEIPSPKNVPAGCRFHTRCPLAGDMCRSVEPGPRDVGSRRVECHLYEPASEMQPVTTQKEASLRLDRSRREE